MSDQADGLSPIKIPDRDAVATTYISVARLKDHEGAASFVKDDLVESKLLV